MQRLNNELRTGIRQEKFTTASFSTEMYYQVNREENLNFFLIENE